MDEPRLADGGWVLDDVAARARAHPDTYLLPPPVELAALGPGHMVRLQLRLLDLADPAIEGVGPYDEDGGPVLCVRGERMWWWVTARDGDDLTVVAQNLPLCSHTVLEPGHTIRCRTTDVIDLDLGPAAAMHDELSTMAETGFPVLPLQAAHRPVEPGRCRRVSGAQQRVCDDAGVRPQMPPIVQELRVLADDGVLSGGTWPVYGVRGRGRADRSDCGWTFWSGEPDMERANRLQPLSVHRFDDLYDTAAWPYVALPPGWVVVVGPDAAPDVYFDPGVL